MWEDPANAHGGKWVLLFRTSPHLLDLVWANLTMALVGEMLDPEDIVCGIVASTRPKIDRIQVWTRSKDDVEGVNSIGRRIMDMMGLEGREHDNISLEFQVSSGSRCRTCRVQSLTTVQRKFVGASRRNVPLQGVRQPLGIADFACAACPGHAVPSRSGRTHARTPPVFATDSALAPVAQISAVVPDGRL